MLKAALIGLGGMGRGHLDNYIRLMNEGADVELIAVCDVNPEKFKNIKVEFNIAGVGSDSYDFSRFHQYTSIDDMLANEKLDLVSIAIPTYLHCEAAVKCLKAGANVFCEKPMALDVEQCQLMIDTANQMGKRLMIGQCLRFWGEYEIAKGLIDSGKLGKPVGGYFWRGGATPQWSFENWYLRKECGGGALHDQHVHDVDMIQYMFGMPCSVSSIGRTVIEGSGFDVVSTNYIYEGGWAINAQDDWTLQGHGFSMTFRINFENGTLYMDHGGFKVAMKGAEPYTPDYNKDSAYYREIVYFIDCIKNNKPNTINPPEDSLKAIVLVTAEAESAGNMGKVVEVKVEVK